jgi:hypothetical protein
MKMLGVSVSLMRNVNPIFLSTTGRTLNVDILEFNLI